MKKGISLIVLVITIIVMIILAASIVISLSNTGIIEKAGQAVQLTDEKQVQDLASLAWAEAYLDETRTDTIEKVVKDKLAEQGVTDADWNITVTDTGVAVTNKNSSNSSGTLGALVTSAEDYGKTINYTANGITDWKVLYKSGSYVYIIASEKVPETALPKNIPGASTVTRTGTVNGVTKSVGNIYWPSEPTSAGNIQRPELWMANWGDYTKNESSKSVSYFLDETYWTSFKNTAKYGNNVIGAVGTPTAEMIAASWNEKREETKDYTKYPAEIILSRDGEKGYFIEMIPKNTDTLYRWAEEPYEITFEWIASPYNHFSAILPSIILFETSLTSGTFDSKTHGVRPVVCLNAAMTASVGTTTDIAI